MKIPKDKKPRNHTQKEIYERLLRMFLDGRENKTEMAEELGISRRTIYNLYDQGNLKVGLPPIREVLEGERARAKANIVLDEAVGSTNELKEGVDELVKIARNPAVQKLIKPHTLSAMAKEEKVLDQVRNQLLVFSSGVSKLAAESRRLLPLMESRIEELIEEGDVDGAFKFYREMMTLSNKLNWAISNAVEAERRHQGEEAPDVHNNTQINIGIDDAKKMFEMGNRALTYLEERGALRQKIQASAPNARLKPIDIPGVMDDDE